MKFSTPALPNGATTLDSFFATKRFSLPVIWTPVQGAASYALLMVDQSSDPVTPTIYWMITYIPPDINMLPENVKNRQQEAGMIQQKNDFDVYGYTTFQNLKHNYVFNIYALNQQVLNPVINPDTRLADFLSAIEPYVIDSAYFKCVA